MAIEPNNAKPIRLDELGYTDVSDSVEEMKILRHLPSTRNSCPVAAKPLRG